MNERGNATQVFRRQTVTPSHPPSTADEQWGVAKALAILTVLALFGLLGTLVVASAGGSSLAEYTLPDGTIDMPRLGEDVYAETCIECHQADGLGEDKRYPPLAGSEWVTADAETPVRILLGGVQGRLRVQGKDYFGTMPAHRQLDDVRIAAVLTYVRQAFGNDAPPVTPDLVRTLRPKTPPTGWTESKLRRAREQDQASQPSANGG